MRYLVYFLGLLVWIPILSPWVLPEARHSSDAVACRRNLNRVQAALLSYSMDHDGNYPTTLAELVPTYLPELPTCPGSSPKRAMPTVRLGCVRPVFWAVPVLSPVAVGPEVETLSRGYRVFDERSRYVLHCTWNHHPEAQPGYPRCSSEDFATTGPLGP